MYVIIAILLGVIFFIVTFTESAAFVFLFINLKKKCKQKKSMVFYVSGDYKYKLKFFQKKLANKLFFEVYLHLLLRE